ncbi:SAC3/GANP domain-containing protein [Histoplasma capsulatum G186AR]|uniref:SAC3/GANP domain-containing protein n=1 Tax=Ajellomyces capsulatus TaxID=5037 RepID=A0A8H7YSB3_AJECA|nr:SAC3/GANP domain-containing protein [Histoplasma capsulatum]QSS74359.1 SAC3/GANP domain-containing protein [Histoplasma capsulatum G186AR]
MSTAPPPWRATAAPVYSSSVSPAYIPVQARRSLAHHTSESTTAKTEPRESSSSPKTADSKTGKSKIDWPPAVRQYVQRSFVPEFQIASVSRMEMEQKLKQVITEAAENGNLYNVDWENLPLPQQMIQNERNKILTSALSASLPSSSPTKSQDVRQQKVEKAKEETPKKRKSLEFSAEEDEPENIPPWRKTNTRNDFENRISYPSTADKRRRIDSNNHNFNSKNSSKLQNNLELRKRRFEDSHLGYQSPQTGSSSRDESPDVGSGPVIGRCQTLEKNYFRLTSAPNPDTVRPLPVLKKMLDLLKKKWRLENNYTYVCDQFKSMRQDLTVQHIKNEFTVNVYEIHARIALEKGDLGEYNQCQTQLRALYSQNLGGHPMEFMAYRILYFIHTRNRTAINDALADLTPADKLDPAVKHALDVRSALALGNYHKFFQLYLDTPNMGAYLMDMFVDRERLAALACICKVYKPEVKIRFITEELGFESDEQAARFILDHAPENLLQEKPDGVKLLTGKAGQVFEVAKAEAHKVVDIKGQI